MIPVAHNKNCAYYETNTSPDIAMKYVIKHGLYLFFTLYKKKHVNGAYFSSFCKIYSHYWTWKGTRTGASEEMYTSFEVTIQSFQYQRPFISIIASIFNKCPFGQPLLQQALSDM